MARRVSEQRRPSDATLETIGTCPSWCVAPHGLHCGEEDWVHTSEPLALTNRILARLCMTVAPDGQTLDGPYVMIGADEFTPEDANALGLALQALASAAAATTRHASL